MVDRARIRLVTGALAAALLPGLSGCADSYYAAPSPTYPPYYYDYYYYPHVDVYFHIYSGHYWYHTGPGWRRVPSLPPQIYLHPRHRVWLRIPSTQPYRYHKEHRKLYPPPPRPGPSLPPQTSVPPWPSVPPQPPPSAAAQQQREWQAQDREERQHNIRQYERYRKKPWVVPK